MSTDIQAKPSLRWVTLDLNDANTFPEKRKWVFWDRGELPPVWGCYDTDSKFADLITVDSSGEEEAEPLVSGYRWLLETTEEKRDMYEIGKNMGRIERNIELLTPIVNKIKAQLAGLYVLQNEEGLPSSEKNFNKGAITVCKDVIEKLNPLLNSDKNVQECDANVAQSKGEPMANNSLEETTEPEKREAENILSLLVELHKYKSDHGKDSFYEERKTQAWERAYKWRDELEKSWSGDSSKGGDLEVSDSADEGECHDCKNLPGSCYYHSQGGGSYVPSDRSPDESPVASHTCTDGNSIEQKITKPQMERILQSLRSSFGIPETTIDFI